MAKKNTNQRRSAAEERFKKTYGKYPFGPELWKFKAWEEAQKKIKNI
jgi:hypothetical protein